MEQPVGVVEAWFILAAFAERTAPLKTKGAAPDGHDHDERVGAYSQVACAGWEEYMYARQKNHRGGGSHEST